MLLPSSIQRADDFVGIAIPIVGFLCASAPLLTAMAEKPTSASVAIMALSFSMPHSLRFLFRARSKRDRELFDAESQNFNRMCGTCVTAARRCVLQPGKFLGLLTKKGTTCSQDSNSLFLV